MRAPGHVRGDADGGFFWKSLAMFGSIGILPMYMNGWKSICSLRDGLLGLGSLLLRR